MDIFLDNQSVYVRERDIEKTKIVKAAAGLINGFPAVHDCPHFIMKTAQIPEGP